jgi:hypothetical protein
MLPSCTSMPPSLIPCAQLLAHSPLRPTLANPGSLPSVQDSAVDVNRVHCEQRERLISLGESPQWISDVHDNDYQVVMLKADGTVLPLDVARQDWVWRRDGTTLTQLLVEERWPRAPGVAHLTNEEVVLPKTLEEFPGDIDVPRYGFKQPWRVYLKSRSTRASAAAAPSVPVAQVPGTSPRTALKVSTGAAWTTAQRSIPSTCLVASTVVVSAASAPLSSSREQSVYGP